MKTAAAILVAALVLSFSHSPPPIEVRRAWPAMGTMLTITAWGGDSANVLSAMQAGRAAVMRVDSLMSSYRDVSDVSRIAKGAGRPVRVSPETVHVLLLAKEYWRMTQGKFDPTIGPLTELWAKARSQGKVPSSSEIAAARNLVGFSRVQIDSAASTVQLELSGMQLDLGGIAKGYALDQARRAMKAGSAAGMVNLGGNILVFGRSPSASGRWKIGIVNPRDADRIVGIVELDSGAIATSADNENFTIIHGIRYSHIIDPVTGRPSRGVASATAIGPRGELSDGMSASFFLLGARRAMRVADSLRGVGSIIIADRKFETLRRTSVSVSSAARRVFRFDAEFH